MNRLIVPGLLALALIIGTAAIGGSGSMIPEVTGSTEQPSDRYGEVLGLNDPKRATQTVDALLSRGQEGTEILARVATTESDLSMRGWAITGLARSRSKLAADTLEQLGKEDGVPPIVRSWAFAARVNRAEDLDTLIALSAQGGAYGVSELVLQRAANFLQGADARTALELSARFPALGGAVSEQLLEVPVRELGQIMLTDDSDPTRRAAASWLGAQAQQRDRSAEVARMTIRQLQHDPKTTRVPWTGGALYIPGIQWERQQARALVRELIRWSLYCERKGLDVERNQVSNNLRSVSLLQVAGFSNAWPNDPQLLEEWARIAGRDDLREILAEQGMSDRMPRKK